MRVLLDGDDRKLDGDTKLGVGDVGLLVSETHGADEAFVLDGAASKVGTDKGGLGDHALPALLGRLLSRADDLEHLLLADALDLGEGHGEAGGLVVAAVLDGAREGLCRGGVAAVEQVLRQRGRVVLLGGRLYVALLVRLDLLLHLDLLLAARLLVQLGPQAAELLGVLGGLVAGTGFLLARALFMVTVLRRKVKSVIFLLLFHFRGRWLLANCFEDKNVQSSTMQLAPPFHILVLRHLDVLGALRGLFVVIAEGRGVLGLVWKRDFPRGLSISRHLSGWTCWLGRVWISQKINRYRNNQVAPPPVSMGNRLQAFMSR